MELDKGVVGTSKLQPGVRSAGDSLALRLACGPGLVWWGGARGLWDVALSLGGRQGSDAVGHPAGAAELLVGNHLPSESECLMC